VSIVLGALLGLGLVLALSPLLWPADGTDNSRPSGGRAREALVQAGLGRVSTTTFAVASVLVGLALAATGFALVPVIAVGFLAGALGLVLPAILVVSRARGRRRAARVMWPDLVDHLVSGVRSGLALPDAVVALAHTGPDTTRESFAAFESDYRATGNFGLCVDRVKERVADPVADRIFETLRMSREVGGTELTTVLRNLATYLRQDAAIRSEVEARQSWTVAAARLGVAAPWIVLLLLSTRPEAASAYNSPAGVGLVVAGLVVTAIAYRLMIALGRLPEERRWFR
jgi:tight adherence protein B